ncbi:MAG: ATP-binding cassette domain-containing protein [Spirochaetales bacterium]|nr:ATP-binding cassette domain-containing protein [Spirochaetales bacterium]
MEDYIFELEEVSLYKGGVPILDNISLKIPRGVTTSIMGVSGSGKTTLLKMIAGLIPPDSGKILYQGKNLFSLGKKENDNFRKSMGFVFQDAALWGNKNIYSNLYVPVKYHFPKRADSDIKAIIEKKLEEVGMLSDRNLRPSQLSTGEQKIISFIRGIINDPDTIFLDNPLLSLDHEASELLQKQIKTRSKRGDTILISDQDHEFLSSIVEFVVIIEEGKLLKEGPISELKDSQNPRIARILEKLLGHSSVYDQDILEILDENDSSGLFG